MRVFLCFASCTSSGRQSDTPRDSHVRPSRRLPAGAMRGHVHRHRRDLFSSADATWAYSWSAVVIRKPSFAACAADVPRGETRFSCENSLILREIGACGARSAQLSSSKNFANNRSWARQRLELAFALIDGCALDLAVSWKRIKSSSSEFWGTRYIRKQPAGAHRTMMRAVLQAGSIT